LTRFATYKTEGMLTNIGLFGRCIQDTGRKLFFNFVAYISQPNFLNWQL